MIIECPSCAKRYKLADDAIPEEGRQVRCAACGTSWRQERAPVAAAEPAPPPIVAPPPPPEPDPHPDPDPDDFPAPPEPPVIPRRAAPTAAPAPPSRIAGNLALGALALILLAAVLLLIPGGLRGVDLGARLEPVQRGSALRLTLHEPIWGKVLDGRSVLTVAGKLDNPAPVTLPVPALEAEVRDGDGALLAAWLTPPPAADLAAGGSLTFDTAAIAVPASARRVAVRFAQTRRK